MGLWKKVKQNERREKRLRGDHVSIDTYHLSSGSIALRLSFTPFFSSFAPCSEVPVVALLLLSVPGRRVRKVERSKRRWKIWVSSVGGGTSDSGRVRQEWCPKPTRVNQGGLVKQRAVSRYVQHLQHHIHLQSTEHEEGCASRANQEGDIRCECRGTGWSGSQRPSSCSPILSLCV